MSEEEALEDGYAVEAKIIAQYMIAGDEALGQALRDAVRVQMTEVVASVWRDPDLRARSMGTLRDQLLEDVKRLSEDAEAGDLHHEIRRALDDRWREDLTKTVRAAVQDFLARSLPATAPAAQLKGVNDFGDALSESARQVIGAELKTALQDIVEDRLREHLNDDRMTQIVKEATENVVRKQEAEKPSAETPWLRFAPLIGVGALLVLLVVFHFMTQASIRKTIAQIPVTDVAQTTSAPPRRTEPDPTPIRNDEPARPYSKMQETFEAAIADAPQPDTSFFYIQRSPELVLDMAYGFRADLASAIREQGAGAFTNSPFLGLSSAQKRAQCMTQALARAVALRVDNSDWASLRNQEDRDAYLASFAVDGAFGPGSRSLTEDALRAAGVDPGQITVRSDGGAGEYLLISYHLLTYLSGL